MCTHFNKWKIWNVTAALSLIICFVHQFVLSLNRKERRISLIFFYFLRYFFLFSLEFILYIFFYFKCKVFKFHRIFMHCGGLSRAVFVHLKHYLNDSSCKSLKQQMNENKKKKNTQKELESKLRPNVLHLVSALENLR